MWVTSSLDTALTPTIVALGNFDGVHRGHQQVVQPILKIATSSVPSTLPTNIQKQRVHNHRLNLLESSHSLSNINRVGTAEQPFATVVTFHPHPQEFFSGQRRTLLTPLEEKVRYLDALGAEQLVLLPFDKELASLTPQEFVEKILVHQLKASRVSVGEDFRFGCQRAGTAADLKELAAAHGIEVTLVPLYTCEGERISSSVIRNSLKEGNLELANHLLGRPYTLIGTVIQGQQLGRTIGFPTANLQLVPEKFLPRQGVYCVRVSITEKSYFCENASTSPAEEQKHSETQENLNFNSSPLSHSPTLPLSSIPGVMNIGYRPTVDGTTPTIEVHLLDWSGDLYGKTLIVSLEKFLRSEQKFPSLEALKAQIQADAEAARVIFRREV